MYPEQAYVSPEYSCKKGTSFMCNSFLNTQGFSHYRRRKYPLPSFEEVSSAQPGNLPPWDAGPANLHYFSSFCTSRTALEGKRKSQDYRRCYSSRRVLCLLGHVYSTTVLSAHPITRVTRWRSLMQSSSSHLPFRRDASKKKRINTIDRQTRHTGLVEI